MAEYYDHRINKPWRLKQHTNTMTPLCVTLNLTQFKDDYLVGLGGVTVLTFERKRGDSLEFEHVYNEIFSSDSSLQQHAFDRLSAWKSRLGDDRDLPHFLVSTSELLAVKLQDSFDYSSDGKNELIVQLTYSMALVRFVNLLTEDVERAKIKERFYSSQTRQPFPKFSQEDKRTTLKNIAKMLGIPEGQVDLRHAATHYKKMPSLIQLRDAVDIAMDYLKENCWKAQLTIKQTGADFESASDIEAMFSQLLLDFMQIRFPEVTTEARLQKRRKSFTSSVLLQLESRAKRHSECLLSLLVEDGYLLFTSEQLVGLGVNPEKLMESTNQLELPQVLIAFWEPVLYAVNNLQLTARLLDLFADKLSEVGSLRDRIISGWIASIMIALENYGKVNSQELNYNRSCSILGRQLLQRILQSPNLFTEALVRRVFSSCVPRLQEDSEEQILELVRCYVSRQTVSEDDENKALYTTHALVTPSGHVTKLARDQQPTSLRSWTLASDGRDWPLWPLGSYCRQNPGYRSLELPSQVNTVDSDTLVITNSPAKRAMNSNSIEEMEYCVESSFSSSSALTRICLDTWQQSW